MRPSASIGLLAPALCLAAALAPSALAASTTVQDDSTSATADGTSPTPESLGPAIELGARYTVHSDVLDEERPLMVATPCSRRSMPRRLGSRRP